MPYSYPLHAGLALLGLTLAACTTTPPAPLPEDHPASIHAPAAPSDAAPSALSAYRDFGTSQPAPPPARAPAMDHSMDEQDGAGSKQEDQEGAHATHR